MVISNNQIVDRWMSNPLFVREMRRAQKPTIRSAIRRGIVIGVIVAFLTLVFLVRGDERGYLQAVLFLYALLIISLPPFAAYTAAAVTSDDMTRQQFEMLHITALSNASLVEGYILSTLFRCRWLIGPIIGFAPFALVASIYVSNSFASCFPNNYLSPTCRIMPSLDAVLLTVLSSILFVLTIAGVCLLSATIGVLLAAWWRNRPLSTFVAPFAGMILIIILLIYTLSFYEPVPPLQRNLVVLPFLYALCGLAILATRPFARK